MPPAAHNVVMTVGVQWMADPTCAQANDMIRRGDIGHVAQAQTSYYRNSLVGQWRYYPLTARHEPDAPSTGTCSWATRFSVVPGAPLAPRMPFDRAIFAQWRCYWDFGGGMFTDLFVHRTTRMIAAMGVRYPARVVGGGGIYLEYDGRDVPDVATIVADYDEGCQLIITAHDDQRSPDRGVHPRPHWRRCKFAQPARARERPARHRLRLRGHPAERSPTARRRPGSRPAARRRFVGGGISEGDGTQPLWENFLECCRTRNRETMQHAGAGRRRVHDGGHGRAELPPRPGPVLGQGTPPAVPADESWARQWERRSHERGRPNQIVGWTGGDRGST